ncbi:MAG: DUF2520 domain-containing protein [Flavobacteriaceae bacterium]|jgi:predicted short-subunit dehydrogenase-like oxidoreductase (DUF2520 family)|nr:DUF2520 domain-containing protein [Flavobacteriaceae bacterium]
MTTITILGSGKVAHQLILKILEQDKLCLQQIYARNPSKVNHLVNNNIITSDFNQLKPADIFIIAVSDDAIAEVSNQITIPNQLVVHTSGTTPIDRLSKHERRGVFYMLQTFSLDKEVDFSEIPYCLEATTKEDFAIMEHLALQFSERVYNINSQQRKSLHLAAVFVNNFTNHLYALGEDICKENEVPFEILKPLILETADKINYLSPKEAQTGPAIRGDQSTINKHLLLLQDANKKQLYELLTKSIQNR